MKNKIFKIIISFAFLSIFLFPFSAKADDVTFTDTDGSGLWHRTSHTPNTSVGDAGTFDGVVSQINGAPVVKNSHYTGTIQNWLQGTWEGTVANDGNSISGTWKSQRGDTGDAGGWAGNKANSYIQKVYTFVGIDGRGDFTKLPDTRNSVGAFIRHRQFTGTTSLSDGHYTGTWGRFADIHASFFQFDLSLPTGDWEGDVFGGKITGKMNVGAGKYLGEDIGGWEGKMENFPMSGLDGTGIWKKLDDRSGTFTGTTTAPDGHYKGQWGEVNFDTIDFNTAGGWKGDVVGGKITGTWQAKDGSWLADPLFVRDNQGSWKGTDVLNQGVDQNYVLPPSGPKTTNTSYNFLEQLPGFDPTFNSAPDDTTNPCPFGKYLNILMNLVIGICAVLAFVMIVMGGIEYMTSELISSKEAGKSSIKNALFGLTVALSAWLVLNTLNPNLLNLCLDKFKSAELTISEDANSAIIKVPGEYSVGGSCAVVTSGPCTQTNLSIFGADAERASKICNIESRGDASRVSKGDVCNDAGHTPFSFGLFQINLIANGGTFQTSDKQSCGGIFVKSDGSDIQMNRKAANYNPYIIMNNGKLDHYDCKIRAGKEDLYNKCKTALLTDTINVAVANKLYNNYSSPHKFQSWFLSDSGICKDPFQ